MIALAAASGSTSGSPGFSYVKADVVHRVFNRHRIGHTEKRIHPAAEIDGTW